MKKDLKAKAHRVGEILENEFGIPEWKGKRGDPLSSLIGTILSQNTNDLNRDRAYKSLKEHFPTWEDVLEADPKDIADAIRVGGLANQKGVRIKNILAWIKGTYGELNLDFLCDMPTEEVYDTFCQLKGVGVKTVSVMLMFACGRDVFPVDTHVNRTSNRLGFVPQGSSPDKTFQLMKDIVPSGKSYSFHINLITLGRRICKSRDPECHQCLLTGECRYYKETVSDEKN